MKRFDGNIPDIQKLSDEKLTQELIPIRFILEIPPESLFKNLFFVVASVRF